MDKSGRQSDECGGRSDDWNPDGSFVTQKRLNQTDWWEEEHLRSKPERQDIGLPDPEADHVWHFKPLAIMLGAGIPGIILLATSFFVESLVKASGISLTTSAGDDMTGLVRMGMLFAGFVFIMVAMPLKQHRDWSMARQDQTEKMRDSFARRNNRGKGT